jgi:oligopeptide/dipeptide ABC transporter ATP-binding protein
MTVSPAEQTDKVDPADVHCQVDNLSVDYYRRAGWGRKHALRVVDGVSFTVDRGNTFGLVGESGCGKTTTGRAIVRLLDPAAGTVVLGGLDVTRLRGSALRRARRRFQMVFQDPTATLDARLSVVENVMEPLVIHGMSRREARAQALQSMSDVGLAGIHTEGRPIELSGGQRQRVAIARAIGLRPDLIVLDEPTSALDVSVQAQVVNLLTDLQREFGLTYVFISHDLSVVRHLSSTIGVMYMGRLVEVTTPEALVTSPAHPYTRALLEVVPTLESSPDTIEATAPLSGDVPSPGNPPSGCRFRTRCPLADATCAAVEPELEPIGSGRRVACHHWLGNPAPASVRE